MLSYVFFRAKAGKGGARLLGGLEEVEKGGVRGNGMEEHGSGGGGFTLCTQHTEACLLEGWSGGVVPKANNAALHHNTQEA